MDWIRQCKDIDPLARIIENEIARSGVISFARYMELALYNRDHGYYRKSHIGKAGDFFTSISVGPLFGQLLAYFLAKQLAAIEGQLHIVEAGANDGALAADILSWLAQNRPEIAEKLRYFVVEPIHELQERQREKLLSEKGSVLAGRASVPMSPNIIWVHSLEDLPPIHGAIISNELLDAFPVHVFRWHRAENQWREYGVDADFTFTPLSALPDWSLEPLSELKPVEPHLPDQFTVEFSPAAENWWRRAAEKLNTGSLITFDYGDESTGLWSPARTQGTLRAYRNHKLVADVLADPGEQDITVSVNFTRIRRAGEAAGLKSEPLQTQSQFLTRIAAEFFKNATASEVRQFQTLAHPDHLGRSFKVLWQRRAPS